MGKTHHIPIPDIGKINFVNSGGFQYEAKAVRECLLQGKLYHGTDRMRSLRERNIFIRVCLSVCLPVTSQWEGHVTTT